MGEDEQFCLHIFWSYTHRCNVLTCIQTPWSGGRIATLNRDSTPFLLLSGPSDTDVSGYGQSRIWLCYIIPKIGVKAVPAHLVSLAPNRFSHPSLHPSQQPSLPLSALIPSFQDVDKNKTVLQRMRWGCIIMGDDLSFTQTRRDHNYPLLAVRRIHFTAKNKTSVWH